MREQKQGRGVATLGFGEEISSVWVEEQMEGDRKLQARMLLRRVQPQADVPAVMGQAGTWFPREGPLEPFLASDPGGRVSVTLRR